MDLFGFDNQFNLLPQDGEVYYYNSIMDGPKADRYFSELLASSDWQHDQLVINGQHITTRRKTAWYGDKEYGYSYSNTKKQALPWTSVLLELKALVEEQTDSKFNSCLLNLYHSGEEGMGWHSDDETELGLQPKIASLSLGAERKFTFKHKQSKAKCSVLLEQGSLLLMQGDTQQYWQHCLPKTITVKEPRINLTFRTIYESR